MKNVLAFFRDPHARLTILSSRGCLKWMSDEQFLKVCRKTFSPLSQMAINMGFRTLSPQ